MQSPKNKAIELLDNFLSYQYPNFTSIQQAKKCSKLTATEIIKNCLTNGCSQDWIFYWEQVIYEIENL